MERQLERLSSNNKGWEQQSKKHQEENQALKAQLQQTQTLLQSIGGALTGQQPTKPKTMAERMNAFLAGDDHAFDDMPQPGQAAAIKPEDINTLVDQRMQQGLAQLNRYNAVPSAHPELNNPKDPLYKEVFELYDQVAQDPLVQQLYPQDQNMLAAFSSPDGSGPKTVDLRILDRATLLVKSRHAAQAATAAEETRQSVGDAVTAGGRQSNSQNNQIEALDLLTPGEVQQYSDPAFALSLRAAGLPTDPKAIAKYIYDGWTATEKAQRVEDYRRRHSVRGAA
jgi:hypothetical protein